MNRAQTLRDSGGKRAPALRDIGRIVIVVAVFIALALAVRSSTLVTQFDIAVWRETLQQGHYAGGAAIAAVWFGLGGAALIVLGVPRVWIAAIFGAIYGALAGSLLALAAATLGASVAYYLGRTFLRGPVQRRVGGRLERWRRRFRDNAFWWVLQARLFPFAHSSLTSLICGACDVPFWPYVRASLLGFIPYTLVFAMFGSGGAKANVWQIAVGFALMLLVYLLRRWGGRSASEPGS